MTMKVKLENGEFVIYEENQGGRKPPREVGRITPSAIEAFRSKVEKMREITRAPGNQGSTSVKKEEVVSNRTILSPKKVRFRATGGKKRK